MNPMTYYQGLIQYLASLKSQIPSTAMNASEANSLIASIDKTIQLAQIQLNDLARNEN